MNENFECALAHVFRHEGGFVNHPLDPGRRHQVRYNAADTGALSGCAGQCG